MTFSTFKDISIVQHVYRWYPVVYQLKTKMNKYELWQKKQMKQLNGKLALITGGNSGIGYAAAKAMVEAGANVIITGRRKEAVKKAAGELNAIPLIADQSSLSDIEAMAQKIASEFGKVDILFVNAGITGKSMIQDVHLDQWNTIVDTNLKGAFFTLSRFIPILNEGASVVFLSSIIAEKPIPGSSLYGLTKAAVNSIVKTAALELAPGKIRVNSISPGPTDTGIFDKMGLNEEGIQKIRAGLQQKIPIGEMGDPADVAAMVVFLCTNASKFITGADIRMDGGMTLL